MGYIAEVIERHIRLYDMEKTGDTSHMKSIPTPNVFCLSEIYAIGRSIAHEIEGKLSDKYIEEPPCTR